MMSPSPQQITGSAPVAVSFDVFDTCLVRRSGPPSELFRLIGFRLADLLHLSSRERFAEDFIEWRTEAERRARRHGIREEITLEEIWRELVALIGLANVDAVGGPRLELELERSGLRPIAQNRARIAAERALGRRILFISDTYLPGSFVRAVLESEGFALTGDSVYASSDVGRTKRSGALFQHVLKAEGIAAGTLCHIGDDLVADVTAPGRLGIRTDAFSQSRRKSLERVLLWRRPPTDSPWIATAGALTAARLAADRSDAPKPVAKLVEQLLGPLLCTFGHWVLRQAAADGIQRLYFASRDARLLWAVCQQLNAAQRRPLDLRYVLVSRQALMLPAIHDVSAESLSWLRRDPDRPTLPRLLSRFELAYDDLAKDWLRFRPGWPRDASLQTSVDWAVFWKFVSSPRIRTRILESARRRSENATAYFAGHGLLDRTPSGFVDLGWYLTCQAAINRIRRSADDTLPEVKGYYLGLKRHRLGPGEAGPSAAVFREHPEDTPCPSHLAWIRRSYLVEQIVGLAEHPSVWGYGAGGTVEFLSSARGMDEKVFRSIEREVLRYVAVCGDCWAGFATDDSQAAQFLGMLLERFLSHPSPDAVELLKDLGFSASQGSADSERLVKAYSWSEVLGALLPLFRRVERSRRDPDWRWWPEASDEATPRFRRAVHRAIGAARERSQGNQPPR